MSDNTARIDQMAAVLTAINTPNTDREIDQENERNERSTEQAVPIDAITGGPDSPDAEELDGKSGNLDHAPVSGNPASDEAVVGEAVTAADRPPESASKATDDTDNTSDMTDAVSIVFESDVDCDASASPEAIVPTPHLATSTDTFEGFPAAPREPREFLLPLCDLRIGEISEGGAYNFEAGAAESLCHAVKAPETIAPIVVMKTADVWHVIDGWARVMAFRFQFGNTANVMVRVVQWDRSRDEALYKRFAQTFLTLKSRKIDKSLLLFEFYLTWNVPQLVLAARIGWTESRVTRELAAAEAMQEAPRFAELHVKAGDPPIDYLYQIQQARDAAAADDKAHSKRAPEKSAVGRLEAKLEALLAKSERFATAEALAKLGIGKPAKEKATAQTADTTGIISALEAREIFDCVEDSGGDAVAMIEMGADQLPSIRLLVDTATLDDPRKAEVRHLVHEALDRLLGF